MDRQSLAQVIIILVLIVLFIIPALKYCQPNPYYSKRAVLSQSEAFTQVNDEQNLDPNHFSYTGEFSGIASFWHYYAEKDKQVNLSYFMSVDWGKAKLILVDGQNSVTNIVDLRGQVQTRSEENHTLHLKKGDNYLKLVATEGTKVGFEVGILPGTFSKIE